MSIPAAYISLILLALSAAPALSQEDAPALSKKPSLDATISQEDNAYLLRHNPFYFAFGNPISKLQLSFRTKLIRHVPLYFAYTQLMFWELEQNSKPFEDFTYNPELFYRFDISGDHWLKSIDTGWAHDSNGKDGDASRSYNTVYARLNAEEEYKHWLVRLSVTGSYLHSFDEGNRDIQKYIGPLMIKLSFLQLWNAWVDKSEFALQIVPGGKFAQNWSPGGYQASWSFRLGGINILPSFYLQFYSGYAESLINYNQYVHAVRAGIIF